MDYQEIWRGALNSFRVNKASFLLTSLGIAIGTAAVILVASVVGGGQRFIIGQIQGIGANIIYAEHARAFSTGDVEHSPADELTIADMQAVQEQVPQIQAASPLYQFPDLLTFPGGVQRNVRVLGVSPAYQSIRNLNLLEGRFFDDQESTENAKNAVITPELATKLFGSASAAIGQTIKLENLAFTVVGVFKERTETFGQSEVADETALIPSTVALYFRSSSAVDQMFFSVAEADQVPAATQAVARVIQSRHRADAVYHVTNLAELLQVASTTTKALSVVLGLISVVTLIIGGVGIMNIMLANIRARVKEIGLRKAIGAKRRDIVLQFLSESLLMSMFGGAFGATTAIALVILVGVLTGYSLPVSTWSIGLALMSAASTGILFGTVPAKRAADLDPVMALHAE